MLKYAKGAIGVAVFLVAGGLGYVVLGLRSSMASHVKNVPELMAAAELHKPEAKKKPVHEAYHKKSEPAKPAPVAKLPTFVQRLAQAGVKTCLPRIAQMGAASMGNVTTFGFASDWNKKFPNTHMAGVLLGQKYGNSPKIPQGFTGVFGAPNGAGRCDGVAVQVLPSPLPCQALQQNIQQKKGKELGNLAGVAFLEDASGQELLVPTAANTCVLVSVLNISEMKK